MRNLIAAYLVGILSPIIAGVIGYYTAGHVTTTFESIEFQKNIEALNKAINQIDSLASSCNDSGTLSIEGIPDMHNDLSGIKTELSKIKNELNQIKQANN